MESKGQYKTRKMQDVLDEKKFSQRYVAREAGIPKNYFNECVRKNKAPKLTPTQTRKLLETLDITLEELVSMYPEESVE